MCSTSLCMYLSDLVLCSWHCVQYVIMYVFIRLGLVCLGYCVQYITVHVFIRLCLVVFRVMCAIHHCVSSDLVLCSGHYVHHCVCISSDLVFCSGYCVQYITVHVFHQTWSCVQGIVCSTSLCMYVIRLGLVLR